MRTGDWSAERPIFRGAAGVGRAIREPASPTLVKVPIIRAEKPELPVDER